MLKFYKFDVKPPHPKTPADWQTSAGKFGTNGEILEIWGKIFGQQSAKSNSLGNIEEKPIAKLLLESRGYTCGKNLKFFACSSPFWPIFFEMTLCCTPLHFEMVNTLYNIHLKPRYFNQS